MSFICLDCQVDTTSEYYVIQRALWKKVNPKIDGMLCIDCLEQRLGRNLTKKDFTQAPLNSQHIERKSALLKNRLGLL
jgi:hypothetical protein